MARIANFPGDNDERQSPLRSEPLPVVKAERNEAIGEKPWMEELIESEYINTSIERSKLRVRFVRSFENLCLKKRN